MGEEELLKPVYRGIGDFFKKQCQGYMGFVFTGNMALGKGIGLRHCRRILFFNSNIECRLLGFALYAGSKKDKTPGTPEPQDATNPV
jgi:putative N6-adenine-specific DNA methylase